MTARRFGLSTGLAIAGLAGMAARLLASPPVGASATGPVRIVVGAICAAPLLLLIVTATARRPQWGAWVAVAMVPYVTLSVGAMLAAPDDRLARSLFAALAVLVFFAGLDAARRR